MTKRPVVSALFISILSAFYAFLFIFISGHMEFRRMVHPEGTLKIPFINAFTGFIMGNNMKYIGYAIIVIAAIILVITLLRRKEYDEYQQSIQTKCALAVGILTIHHTIIPKFSIIYIHHQRLHQAALTPSTTSPSINKIPISAAPSASSVSQCKCRQYQ
ncbi:MAG TPA: hypothetical protein VFD00_06780 [Thermoclostridium sp.]|nr:hypothetical protein [Thermoclostridium sp.]